MFTNYKALYIYIPITYCNICELRVYVYTFLYIYICARLPLTIILRIQNRLR